MSQEAGRRILELNEVVNSLSVLVKEKEEQLSELKNEFSRKEKVINYYNPTFHICCQNYKLFHWLVVAAMQISSIIIMKYSRQISKCGGLGVCILSCQIKISSKLSSSYNIILYYASWSGTKLPNLNPFNTSGWIVYSLHSYDDGCSMNIILVPSKAHLVYTV